MRKEQPLPSGMTARVEQNVKVIGLVDEQNPYWYLIERPDGTREEVNISRLRWFSDEARATIDYDGCVQIYTAKLTAKGAIDLYHWLRCNLAQLEDAAAAVTMSEESTTAGKSSLSGSTK